MALKPTLFDASLLDFKSRSVRLDFYGVDAALFAERVLGSEIGPTCPDEAPP
ncbi:hypothetical protein [Microvirga lotononidis]|uniref:hypothetical protein n=1 Tax=Microvirga lotononidis TaxID=864069 RepID=UPI0002F7B1EB|nr:hypothetical protein [Microvirga lotononidis]WQO28470.1 hypothetical protein U0023_05120 [Microvirga lotononidis]